MCPLFWGSIRKEGYSVLVGGTVKARTENSIYGSMLLLHVSEVGLVNALLLGNTLSNDYR